MKKTPMEIAYAKAKKSTTKLSAKQKSIASAANPKDKITGADFKALKGKKKKSKAPSMKKMKDEEDDEQSPYSS